MPDEDDLVEPDASVRAMPDDELLAYRESCDDWRDRILAERELARRARWEWPRWLRLIYWPMLIAWFVFVLYLIRS